MSQRCEINWIVFVSEWVTRSPIELFWTAQKYVVFHFVQYIGKVYGDCIYFADIVLNFLHCYWPLEQKDILTSSLGSAFTLRFPLNLLSATEDPTRRATTRNLPAAILIRWPAGVSTSTAPLPLTSAPLTTPFKDLLAFCSTAAAGSSDSRLIFPRQIADVFSSPVRSTRNGSSLEERKRRKTQDHPQPTSAF